MEPNRTVEHIQCLLDALVQEPNLTDEQVKEALEDVIGHASLHLEMYVDIVCGPVRTPPL